jgi:peptide/nickel transport system permease protein
MVDQVADQVQPVREEEEEINVASQWRLMWWRFRRHKPAMVATGMLLFFYVLFPFAEFLGIGDPAQIRTQFHYLRPQALHLLDEGKFSPYVNGLRGFRDPFTAKKDYEVLGDEKLPVGFFVQGYKYKMLGLVESRRHLIGFTLPDFWDSAEVKAAPDDKAVGKLLDKRLKERPSLYLLGSDKVGRDQYSRMLQANRISLSIGLVGVSLSFIGGIILGGISGYYGGVVDTFIQRIIELFNSVPSLPLWIGLSAAVPSDWSVLQVYLAITIILSLFQWTGTARVVRGKFLALREEDFVMAATLAGANEGRIMFRHMLPSFYSHIIAAVSIAIPGMILGEIALSFLGLGLRPPAVSYGIMLQQAQNPQVVALYPWLMFVAIPVIFIVLCYNFVGDGIRDAADPYGGR